VDILAKAEQSFLEHLSTTFFGHNPPVTRLFCAMTPRGGERGRCPRGPRWSGTRAPQLGINFFEPIYTLLPATGRQRRGCECATVEEPVRAKSQISLRYVVADRLEAGRRPATS